MIAKGKVISALRKLTYSHKPRTKAKKKQQVAPAAFQCKHCEVIIYERQKDPLPKKLTDNYKRVIKDKVYMDHIEPVIDPEKGWQGWDVYIERMFCEEDGYQCLCRSCHDSKTFLENQLRKGVEKDTD